MSTNTTTRTTARKASARKAAPAKKAAAVKRANKPATRKPKAPKAKVSKPSTRKPTTRRATTRKPTTRRASTRSNTGGGRALPDFANNQKLRVLKKAEIPSRADCFRTGQTVAANLTAQKEAGYRGRRKFIRTQIERGRVSVR